LGGQDLHLYLLVTLWLLVGVLEAAQEIAVRELRLAVVLVDYLLAQLH
jgi:hypothetical protein